MAPTAPGLHGFLTSWLPSPILPPCHTVPATCAPLCSTSGSLDTALHVGFPTSCLFFPEMFPSLACLENSYSYEKAQLACHFMVSPDSAKQSVWSVICALSELDSPTRCTICHVSFSRPCPLEAGGTVRSERWRALLGAPSSGKAVPRALTATHTEGETSGGAALGLRSRLPGERPVGGPLSGAQGGLGPARGEAAAMLAGCLFDSLRSGTCLPVGWGARLPGFPFLLAPHSALTGQALPPESSI